MNNSKDELVQPFEILGSCCCMKCGAPLYAADTEMTYMRLDKNGMPIQEETEINCRGVCPNCKSVYPLKRCGFGYRMTSPALERDIAFNRKRELHKK